MLLATLDLSLHATTGLAPLTKIGSSFFIASLISQLLVLVVEPELLQLLLLHVSRRVVRKVARLALELIDCGVLDLLLTIRVECLVGWPVGGALSLAESTLHV